MTGVAPLAARGARERERPLDREPDRAHQLGLALGARGSGRDSQAGEHDHDASTLPRGPGPAQQARRHAHHRLRARALDHRPVGIGRSRDLVEPLVLGIVDGPVTGSFRGADVPVQDVPVATALARAVGEDQVGAPLDRETEVAGIEGDRVLHELTSVEQPRRRGIDEAVAVARDDDRPVGWLRVDDPLRVEDREQRDGRRGLGSGRRPRRVRHRGAEGDGGAEPIRRGVGQQAPEDARHRGVVPPVLEIGAQRHCPGAQEAGHRRQRGRVERAVLDPTVESGEQVHRRRRAVREQLPRDVRAIRETRGDGLHGVAPAIGAEQRAGDLEDPRRVPTGVEGGGGGLPITRHVLGPLDTGRQVTVAQHREEADHHAQHDGAGRRDPKARARRERADSGREQAGKAEDDHGHDARRVAQGETEGRAVRERLEDRPERARIAVGPGADPDHDADHDEHHEVPR